VLELQVRGTFDRHAADDHVVGLRDLLDAETEVREQAETGLGQRLHRDAEAVVCLFTDDPWREREAQLEHPGQGLLDLGDVLVGETRRLEALAVDVRSAEQGVRARDVRDDFCGLRLGIAETPERERHRLIDDLEVAAARELLELDQ
jgi:hypothetical protein